MLADIRSHHCVNFHVPLALYELNSSLKMTEKQSIEEMLDT